MSKRQPKLTRWFSCYTKPTLVGEYETKWLKNAKPIRRTWNGRDWMHPVERRVSSLQLFYWRGLAVKP